MTTDRLAAGSASSGSLSQIVDGDREPIHPPDMRSINSVLLIHFRTSS
jgi:hypothetical protein